MLQKCIYMHTHGVFAIWSHIQDLWTLVDPNMYMCRVDIFPYYSLYFFLSYSFPKDIIIPHIVDNCMTDFPHHHSIMYTPLYSPVYFTFSCYL